MSNLPSRSLLALVAIFCVASSLGGCTFAVPHTGISVMSLDEPASTITCTQMRAGSPTYAPVPQGHPTYQRTILDQTGHQQTRHPGDSMRFLWCALPGPYTSAAAPQPESLNAQLIGPFRTKAAAEAAESAIEHVPPDQTAPSFTGTTVVSAPVLQTTNWDGDGYSATLTVPRTAPSGYYVFAVMDTLQPPSGESGGSIPTTTQSAIGVVQVVSG